MISEQNILKIFQYYNPTDLLLTSTLDNNISMTFNVDNDKMDISVNSNKYFKANALEMSNSNLKFCDNFNNIINTFVHEQQHYNDFLKYGAIEYLKITKEIREQRAIYKQMDDISYRYVSPAFKKAIINYAKLNKLKSFPPNGEMPNIN